MKKLFLSLAFLIVFLFSKAQTSNNKFKLDVGAIGVSPIGKGFADDQSYGGGGFIKGTYKIFDKINATITTSYNSFSGKTIPLGSSSIKISPAQVFSILGGGSYDIGGAFYIDAGAGFATISQRVSSFGTASTESYNSFTYSVGMSYRFVNGVTILAEFNGLTNQLPFEYFGLGVSYAIIK